MEQLQRALRGGVAGGNPSLATLALVLVGYMVCIAVYRLYLSPIASVPGPRLAALTQWYERYYEIFKPPGGQFLFHYRKLHEKYGPILRLSPNEVHFQDPAFYFVLYSRTRAWDRPQHFKYRFRIPGALVPTPEHHVHRRRRQALNPFFSKRRISLIAPLLQQQADRLCYRLEHEWKGTDKVLRLNRAFSCFTADALTTICFDNDNHFLDADDFISNFIEALAGLTDGIHILTQFPWLAWTLYYVPNSWLAAMSPAMKPVTDFDDGIRRQVRTVLKNRREKNPQSENDNVFNALVDSDLPPEDLEFERLANEGFGIMGAGLETSVTSLSNICFHAYNNPRIIKRLKAELKQAIPDPSSFPSLEELEKLPYLTACLKETLRLVYGTSQRSARVSDEISLEYGGFTIPPGTLVSMDIYSIHHDESIFPDSYTYSPERWLDNPRAPDGKPLETYLVSFSLGTRSCLGMNFAWAELYIVIANLFRKFDFELYETDRTAVDCYRDMFTPQPKPGTVGVRVLVK